MTSYEVQIGAVRSEPFTIIVQAENLVIRKRDAIDGVSPAIVAILVLVDVVTKMDHVINRVLRIVSLVILMDVYKRMYQPCGQSCHMR